MTTVTTIADATKLVNNFYAAKKASVSSGSAAKGDFQMDARKRVYRMIGDAAEVILQLMSNQEVFGQLCSRYNTKPAANGDNPYSPGIRILFRRNQGGKNVFDKSAWKYGKVIRYGLEQGWKPDQFENRLEGLELTIDGKVVKRMLAAELQDTKNHGDKDAEETRALEIAAQAFMLRQPGLGAFSAGLGVDAPENGQLISVVASYDEASDRWLVRGLANANHDRAWASVKKDVLAEFNKAREDQLVEIETARLSSEYDDGEQLMADLDTHNAEVDAFNATAGEQRKVTVWDQSENPLFSMPSEHAVPVNDQDGIKQDATDSNAA